MMVAWYMYVSYFLHTILMHFWQACNEFRYHSEAQQQRQSDEFDDYVQHMTNA